eukprot:scaffold93491_cov66-Phaeocystis_antarctica.AAC.2
MGSSLPRIQHGTRVLEEEGAGIAHAVRVQRTRSAHAAHTQRTRSARAVHAQCTRSARAVHASVGWVDIARRKHFCMAGRVRLTNGWGGLNDGTAGARTRVGIQNRTYTHE